MILINPVKISQSPCKNFSVAQHKVLAREAGIRFHRRTATRGLRNNREVSAAFVTIRANG